MEQAKVVRRGRKAGGGDCDERNAAGSRVEDMVTDILSMIGWTAFVPLISASCPATKVNKSMEIYLGLR